MQYDNVITVKHSCFYWEPSAVLVFHRIYDVCFWQLHFRGEIENR